MGSTVEFNILVVATTGNCQRLRMVADLFSIECSSVEFNIFVVATTGNCHRLRKVVEC